MTSLARASATWLLRKLRVGQVSAVELMSATLDRIAACNSSLNAVVALRDCGDLMAEAEAADRNRDKDRGALHGLPIAVKDLVNVAGLRSTQGSPLLADHVPVSDDLVAARLRSAGAIIVGKTNTPEFGLGSHTFNSVYGVTLNPYDLKRSCGGSSGGAAVALASGMLALADGSDMMGSLRNPAAWNNVYGFRPSWGMVPCEPFGDTFLHQLATLGPMARSPEDMALLLDVMAGPDPRLPHSLPYRSVGPIRDDTVHGARIGWLGDWDGAFPMEAGILDLCAAAIDVFADLGCVVEPVLPPFDAEIIWRSWTTLRSWQVSMSLREFRDRPEHLKDSARWELERGLALSAMQVHDASVARSNWFACAAGLLERYDALVLPSAQVWPFPAKWHWPESIAGHSMDTYHRWMQVVVPVSLIGLPAAAVPAGFGDAGLPMGFQLFGRRGSDTRILNLAQAYHRVTEWPQRFPART